jgi:hypothetical protein
LATVLHGHPDGADGEGDLENGRDEWCPDAGR